VTVFTDEEQHCLILCRIGGFRDEAQAVVALPEVDGRATAVATASDPHRRRLRSQFGNTVELGAQQAVEDRVLGGGQRARARHNSMMP